VVWLDQQGGVATRQRFLVSLQSFEHNAPIRQRIGRTGNATQGSLDQIERLDTAVLLMAQDSKQMQGIKMIRRPLKNMLVKFFRPLPFAISMGSDRPLQNAGYVLIPGMIAHWLPVASRHAGAKRGVVTGVFRSCPTGHEGARIESHMGEIRLPRS